MEAWSELALGTYYTCAPTINMLASMVDVRCPAADVDMLLEGKPQKSEATCSRLLDRVAWTLVVT